jgi:hypothetical protein
MKAANEVCLKRGATVEITVKAEAQGYPRNNDKRAELPQLLRWGFDPHGRFSFPRL